jgi:transcription initiation factor TFIID TATA-box-binding protein
VENVVASASVDQKMDLNEITRTFPDVEYHPEQFPGLVFRLKVPKTATLIFTSGKMVCTGSKSEEMARKAVKTVVQQLRKGGIKIKKDATVEIQNIVASINLGGKIHLEQAARTLPRSMYEPEQFPGLIHRMLDPKTVILLFSSGKLVCTGAKKEPDVYRISKQLACITRRKKSDDIRIIIGEIYFLIILLGFLMEHLHLQLTKMVCHQHLLLKALHLIQRLPLFWVLDLQ